MGTEYAITGGNGEASAGSWVLGSAPGDNTVTATATFAEGHERVVQFLATGEPRRPTTLIPLSPTTQSTPIGAPVAMLPSLRVIDQVEAPIAGFTVTFEVTGGSGSAQGTSATTDAQGIATVGGWRVGGAAGVNTLTASVADLAPVHFTATAEGRAPASILPAFTPGGGVAGDPLPDGPRVRVMDHTKTPMAGVTVTFTVTAGGGSISPASSVTDHAGIAVAGTWTLGETPGPNTLAATVPGLPAVVFTVAGEAP